MLKYLVIGLLAVLFSVSNVSAQKSGNGKSGGKGAERRENFKAMTPEQRAEAATKRMTKRYALRPEQVGKIQVANSEFTNQMNVVNNLREAEPATYRAERKKARESHKAAIRAILDDKQKAQFDADLAARKARQDARRAAKGKAPKGAKKGEDATIFESLEDHEDEGDDK